MKKLQLNIFISIIILTIAILTLTACFGSKAPDRIYFSLDYPLENQKRFETPKYDRTIIIQPFTTNTAYDRQEIVYRSNPYEFQYYWYRLWASKPRKMIHELLTQHLRHTNVFTNIDVAIADKVPDYILNAEILAIEELDATTTEWYAHLAMRISISRFKDSVVIWAYEFDTKKAVAMNQPIYIVKAISEILEAELSKAFDNLADTIDNYQPAISEKTNITSINNDANTMHSQQNNLQSTQTPQTPPTPNNNNQQNNPSNTPQNNISNTNEEQTKTIKTPSATLRKRK